MMKFFCCVSLVFLSVALQAENIEFPVDSGVINVKTHYGAVGDGVTDDTQAILNAIKENVGKNKIIYFPNGTYLVSDRLEWRDSSGEFTAYLTFQGQSRANTIIKLKDSSTGYTDPSTPKAVIFTASLDDGAPEVYDRSKGEGLQAFRNSMLVAHNMSGFVASNMSGFTHEEKTGDETDRMATGDTAHAI